MSIKPFQRRNVFQPAAGTYGTCGLHSPRVRLVSVWELGYVIPARMLLPSRLWPSLPCLMPPGSKIFHAPSDPVPVFLTPSFPAVPAEGLNVLERTLLPVPPPNSSGGCVWVQLGFVYERRTASLTVVRFVRAIGLRHDDAKRALRNTLRRPQAHAQRAARSTATTHLLPQNKVAGCASHSGPRTSRHTLPSLCVHRITASCPL